MQLRKGKDKKAEQIETAEKAETADKAETSEKAKSAEKLKMVSYMKAYTSGKAQTAQEAEIRQVKNQGKEPAGPPEECVLFKIKGSASYQRVQIPITERKIPRSWPTKNNKGVVYQDLLSYEKFALDLSA